jgi:DNA-binding transcriptional ArsR family regulator
MPTPYDTSRVIGKPLRAWLADLPLEQWETAISLAVDRVIHLLRRGATNELLDEALAIHQHLEFDPGAILLASDPHLHGRWTALGELLSEAARKTDAGAVDALLRAHRGKARETLDLLAQHDGRMARSSLRRELDLSESHLSHLLRDLEESELIVRHRPEGSKEVVVELDWVGHNIVNSQLAPAWAAFVAERCASLHRGDATARTREQLEGELRERGVPSTAIGTSLAESLATDEDERLAIAFNEKVERESPTALLNRVDDGCVLARFGARNVA